MVWLKKIWRWIITPYVKIKQEYLLRKRIKQLQEKDPFIYK